MLLLKISFWLLIASFQYHENLPMWRCLVPVIQTSSSLFSKWISWKTWYCWKFHSACLLILFSTMKTFTNCDPMSWRITLKLLHVSHLKYFLFIRSAYSYLEGDALEMRKFIVIKWMLERISTGIQYKRWLETHFDCFMFSPTPVGFPQDTITPSNYLK
jgi:hypothetical protein